MLTVPRPGGATTVSLLYAVLLAALLGTIVAGFDGAVNASAPTSGVTRSVAPERDAMHAATDPATVRHGALGRPRPLAAFVPGPDGVGAAGGSHREASRRELLGTLRSELVRGCVGVGMVAASGAIALGVVLRRAAVRLAVAAEGADGCARPPTGAADEFRRLEDAVAAIPPRVARLRVDGRRAAAMIAHDLRTPVAGVRLAVESAVAAESRGTGSRDALARALRRCDDLAELLAALLRIAEIERSHPVAPTPADLASVAEFVFEAFEPAVADGGRSLRLLAGEPVHVAVDRALMVQALANLLDNAQLHTPPGTRIEIGVDGSGSEARVWVSDDGPGVPDADRELLAQPFFRTERGRSVRGHGLGLSMVAAVAAAHGGRMIVGRRDGGGGLRVELLLPATAHVPTATARTGGRRMLRAAIAVVPHSAASDSSRA